jgi:outer membrane receptor for ferrienterochelin and colicin
VSVDGNGIIRIRDEGNIKLLINGRPTNVSIGDLKSMTGNMLKSIEVITSPSAKYDGEGIGGLININLRKDSNLGINGAAFLT